MEKEFKLFMQRIESDGHSTLEVVTSGELSEVKAKFNEMRTEALSANPVQFYEDAKGVYAFFIVRYEIDGDLFMVVYSD